MSRLFLSLLCATSLATGLIPVAAWGEDATPPGMARPVLTLTTRAAAHADFDRLVFDWPFETPYKLERKDDILTLRFDRSATIALKPFMAAQLTRVANFELVSSDPLTVRARIAPSATIRDFRSGKAVALDIRGPVVPKTAPPTDAAAPNSSPAPAPPPKPVSKAVESANQASAPAAAAAAAAAAAPAPQAIKPSEASPATAPGQTVTADPLGVAVSSSVVDNAANLNPIAALPTQELPNLTPDQLGLSDKPLLVASFDPKLVIGTVVFERAGYGYILFDRKLALSLVQLTGGIAPKLEFQPLDLPKNSGFRFRVPEKTQLRAGLKGTSWQIFLSSHQQEIPLATTLLAQPEFALGARLFFPTTQSGEPFLLTDPVVGDTLALVPLSEAAGFGITRKLANLTILPSAQGLVIRPLFDKLVLRGSADGVEITAPDGLRLSSSDDTGKATSNQPKQKRGGRPLFDLVAWRGKQNEDFTYRRQKLMQAVVDVPIAERNRARLELARHYFAYGMGVEAIAMLDVVHSDIPDLASNNEFLALRGAAKIQANRPDEGLVDLEKSGLGNQPEIELWQAVGLAKLRDWPGALEKFDAQEDVLANYPEPFASDFYVLAIEAAVAGGKDRLAAEWLDRIEAQPHQEAIKPALSYLRGVLNSKAGRPEQAAVLWREVASQSKDRLYRIRAELALTDLGVATKSLTSKQAADRLEGLRFAWRGDELEIDILQRLGEFYLDIKDYKSGLSVLAQAVKLYPSSPQAATIQQLMAATFYQIFVQNQTEGLSPLAALALYQDYHDLMPKGEEAQAVIFNLAENLVAIDLLDQATALLEDQIKLTNDAENKLKLSTRLAAIYLLDRKSVESLAALDKANSESAPSAILAERQLLRARALSEQGKYNEALGLLQNADSQIAKILRADILNRAKRWSEAATTLQGLIGAPPPAGTPLPEQKASWLVNCALAYALSGDSAALDRLAIDFGAAMSGTTQNTVFRILTRPDKALQPKDIIAAQAKISEVDLFRSFLDGYRKQ
jgi:hypothetical protein